MGVQKLKYVLNLLQSNLNDLLKILELSKIKNLSSRWKLRLENLFVLIKSKPSWAQAWNIKPPETLVGTSFFGRIGDLIGPFKIYLAFSENFKNWKWKNRHFVYFVIDIKATSCLLTEVTNHYFLMITIFLSSMFKSVIDYNEVWIFFI